MEIRVLEGLGLPLPDYLSEEAIFQNQLAGLHGLGGVLDSTENIRPSDILYVANKFLSDLRNALNLSVKILKKRNADTRGIEILANSCTSYNNLRSTLYRFENGNLSGLNTENMLLSGVEQILAGLGFIKKLVKKAKSAVKKVASKVKKVAKKAATGIKKVTKKVGTAVKKAAVATGKGIAKAAKVVGKGIVTAAKAVVKFNPLSALVMGGMLAAFRLNMFYVSSKIIGGLMTKEQFMSLGYTADSWEKSKKAYESTKKAYNVVLVGMANEKNYKVMNDAIKSGYKAYAKKRKIKLPEGFSGVEELEGLGAVPAVVAPALAALTALMTTINKLVGKGPQKTDGTTETMEGDDGIGEEQNSVSSAINTASNLIDTGSNIVAQTKSVVSNFIPSVDSDNAVEEQQEYQPQHTIFNQNIQPMSTSTNPSVWDKITGTVNKVANVASTVSNATTQITDTVRQPVTVTQTYVPQSQQQPATAAKSPNKMVLFAGIAAAALVGGILLMRKKSK